MLYVLVGGKGFEPLWFCASGFCCRECGAPSEGAISSPTGCCSPSTICTPPWSIPAALADFIYFAYPARRWQSAWMSIIVHSGQSVFVIVFVLGLVLS
jgi:hypothetical protein